MKQVGFYLVLACFFLFYSLHPDDDPLLRRPWISTAIEEEERSFNRVGSELLSRPHFRVSSDSWGRKFKTKHNGEVEYILDEKYIQKFPLEREPYLALSEANSLIASRQWIPAYHLLEGLLLCFRREQNTFRSKTWEIKANQMKNDILKKNLDKSQEFEIRADPYGCLGEGKTYLESKAFHYNLEIPSDWDFEYNRDIDYLADIKKEYSARYQRFYKIVDTRKGDTLEEQYIISEQGLDTIRKKKVIFFIGSLFQKQPLFNKNTFYKIWDQKRGINKTTLRSWNMKRKESDPGYIFRFVIMDEVGNPSEYVIREFFYWRKNRGIFLSLSYPSSQEEEMENTWKIIIASLKVKE